MKSMAFDRAETKLIREKAKNKEKTMRVIRTGLISLVVFCLLATAAYAGTSSGTLEATFDNATNGRNVWVYYTPDSGSVVSEYTTAGQYIFTRTGGDYDGSNNILGSPGSLSVTFPLNCIDVEGTIRTDGTIYKWDVLVGRENIVNAAPSKMPPGGPITGLQYDRLLKLYGLSYSNFTNDTIEAAAFAAAIWEIVWESDKDELGVTIIPTAYDVTTGLLRVSGDVDVTDRAQVMLDDVIDDTGTATGTLIALVTQTDSEGNLLDGQDQMVGVGYGYAPNSPVPEPLTVASAFFAIGGLGAYIRRRTGRAVA